MDVYGINGKVQHKSNCMRKLKIKLQNGNQ